MILQSINNSIKIKLQNYACIDIEVYYVFNYYQTGTVLISFRLLRQKIDSFFFSIKNTHRYICIDINTVSKRSTEIQ